MFDYSEHLKKREISWTKIEDVSYIFNLKWLIKIVIWEIDTMRYQELKLKIKITIMKKKIASNNDKYLSNGNNLVTSAHMIHFSSGHFFLITESSENSRSKVKKYIELECMVVSSTNYSLRIKNEFINYILFLTQTSTRSSKTQTTID